MNGQAAARLSRLGVRVREALPQGRGLPADEWDSRHRGLLAIAWIHAVAVPAFGIAQGYDFAHAVAESSVIAVAAVVASVRGLGRNVRMAAISIGLLSASALLVHFSGGYIEFHFHFFVMIGLLSLYQHWMPFLLAIAYVALHHGVGGVIDPGAVYNHPDGMAKPWKWAGIHAAFVLAASTANIFAWRYFEREQGRRRDLLRVTEAALSRLPLPELLDEVLLRVSEVLKADTATISLWDDDRRLVIEAVRGGGAGAKGATLPIDDVIAAGISRRRKPVVVDDARSQTVSNPVHHERQIRSLAGVPLLVGGKAIGILDVGTVEARHFGSSDVTLLELAAERIAPAIDRARVHERDHRIAVVLQQSLLPKSLPSLEGVSVAFRYRPAGESIEAGGDWYDAFKLTGGRLGLAIGDVVGRGTEAASLMGQLRTGLRAYAMEGHPPAEILSRLSRLARDLGEGNMATLLYAELDPQESSLRYASAGHPPALMVGPSGRAEYLWGGRGVPIGTSGAAAWSQAESSLEPGSTLVLCTDGLIETRAAPIDDGLRRLEQTVLQKKHLDAERLCGAVIEQVSAKRACDDVAVMVVKVALSLGPELRLEYPAVPQSAALVRDAVERWLRDRGADAAPAHDVVIASGEASANTIEHAYGPAEASFRLVARQLNGEVEVEVADAGRWRPPRISRRGRGLLLMNALMDSVEVDRGPGGTTVLMRKRLSTGNGARAEADVGRAS